MRRLGKRTRGMAEFEEIGWPRGRSNEPQPGGSAVDDPPVRWNAQAQGVAPGREQGAPCWVRERTGAIIPPRVGSREAEHTKHTDPASRLPAPAPDLGEAN
jgi:hypothetical protein